MILHYEPRFSVRLRQMLALHWLELANCCRKVRRKAPPESRRQSHAPILGITTTAHFRNRDFVTAREHDEFHRETSCNGGDEFRTVC